MLLLLNFKIGAQTITFSSDGTFTAPPGVTEIKVECWGAGGAGGSRTTNGRAGGGGGGAYARSIVTVIPGNTYTIIVGTGGSNGNAGSVSSFNSTTVVAAGGSGVSDNTLSGATGGTLAASTGDIIYIGGNGGDGTTGPGSVSGGGGGGAGSNGAGGNASTNTAGLGSTNNGGNGGAGRTNNGTGNGGNNYGGGGGGARGNGNDGGSGANGLVMVTLPAIVSLSSPNQILTSSVLQGASKWPLFSFTTTVSAGSNAVLNTLNFTSSGIYASSDISNFQLWYNTSDNLATATKIGSDITTSLGPGLHTFSGLSNITNAGTTGYFWITANISSSATPNATIAVNAVGTSDLTYELVKK
ncbi:MAG: hypothetical protein HC830_12735, partial [Bacteroidetes bacterium]|nr:hypothetical protein [Bacteroidota bacterium]